MSKSLRIIGMMSGTSLDGIDVALLETDGETHLTPLAMHAYPYDCDLQGVIRQVLGTELRTPKVREVEREVTEAYYRAILQFLEDHGIDIKTIDAVGIHGQTIFHQPRSSKERARTLQLGDGELLATRLGVPVVYQFRQNDIAYGGEGAPLVPIFHKALMGTPASSTAVLNIGGVANITYMAGDHLVAFDTGPGNALLNDWVYAHTQELYDPEGRYASRGQVLPTALEDFLKHPYFNKAPPKSLDRNTFGCPFAPGEVTLNDGAATLTEMMCQAVRASCQFLPHTPEAWFVAGGGVHNQMMMGRLREILSPATVQPLESLGWSADFLEAMAFAYLAARSLKGLPLTFPATTGVSHPVSGGVVCLPRFARGSFTP